MELVHDNLVDVGMATLAQGDVGKDLGGAADDGGIGVDGGVAGDHADIGGSEDLAEAEEFLADEGFDGGGVVGASSRSHAGEVGCGGDEGFPGPGRGSDDDVVARQDLEDRLLLVLVHGDAVPGDGSLDVVQGHVGVERTGTGGVPARLALPAVGGDRGTTVDHVVKGFGQVHGVSSYRGGQNGFQCSGGLGRDRCWSCSPVVDWLLLSSQLRQLCLTRMDGQDR